MQLHRSASLGKITTHSTSCWRSTDNKAQSATPITAVYGPYDMHLSIPGTVEDVLREILVARDSVTDRQQDCGISKGKRVCRRTEKGVSFCHALLLGELDFEKDQPEREENDSDLAFDDDVPEDLQCSDFADW
eukprot:5323172-Amphidinium_carterae.1